MAERIRTYDVWFLAANTVYRGVPFQVAAEWVQGGRLAATDQLRPGGTERPWTPLSENALLADYLPQPEAPPVAASEDGQPVEDWGDFEPAEPRPRRRRADEDDDPDMIPLIDISLVLLIFFMMIRAAGALSPVDVPDMQFAGELSTSADTLTLAIEKRSADEVVYSLRVGEQGPTPENASLRTPEAVLSALDAQLATAQRPPDVRIACAKELPNERVYELVRELAKRKSRGLINSYDAEVNEKAQS